MIDLARWPHTALALDESGDFAFLAREIAAVSEQSREIIIGRVLPMPTIPVHSYTRVRTCAAVGPIEAQTTAHFQDRSLWTEDRKNVLARVLQRPHVRWFRRWGLVGAFAQGLGVCRDRAFP